MPLQPIAPGQTLDDAELVRRIARHDNAAFEIVVRRHNAALYRAARSILKDDADAEDVLQDSYIAAYRHIADFRGGAKLSTWLTRIVINQALARLRTRKRDNVVGLFEDERGDQQEEKAHENAVEQDVESPEKAAIRAQMRRLIEQKIDALPLVFRTAFVLREVEGMTVDETAACLSISGATVRTRVFRAKALLRASLAQEMDMATIDVFGFAGARCDRVVAAVLGRVGALAVAAEGGRPSDPMRSL